MDNCDSHGRSSSTGSELKRVYEYSSRFCSAVVIYFRISMYAYKIEVFTVCDLTVSVCGRSDVFFISYPVFMKFPRIMQLHIE